MSERAKTIDTLLDERRTFAPSAEFLSKARVTDSGFYAAAEADPEVLKAIDSMPEAKALLDKSKKLIVMRTNRDARP